MSISISNVENGSGSGVISTGSHTTVLGQAYVATINAFQQNAPEDPTISNALGITWTKIGTTQYGSNGGTAVSYWGVCSSPTTGVWNVTFPDGLTTLPWNNPSNALVADGSYSSQVVPSNFGEGNTLRFNLSDLGVPSGSTITDISLNVISQTTTTSLSLGYQISSGVSGSETFYGSNGTLTFTSTGSFQTFNLSSIFSTLGLAAGQKAASFWNSGTSYIDLYILGSAAGEVDIDNVQMGVTYSLAGSHTISPQNFTTTPLNGYFAPGFGGIWWIDTLIGTSFTPSVQWNTTLNTGKSAALSLNPFQHSDNGTYNVIAIFDFPNASGVTAGSGSISGGTGWSSTSIDSLYNSYSQGGIGIATSSSSATNTSWTYSYTWTGGSNVQTAGWGMEVQRLNPATSYLNY